MPRTGCGDPWLSGAGARHHWAWISSPGLASLRLHACAGVPRMGASRAMLVCPELGWWKGRPAGRAVGVARLRRAHLQAAQHAVRPAGRIGGKAARRGRRHVARPLGHCQSRARSRRPCGGCLGRIGPCRHAPHVEFPRGRRRPLGTLPRADGARAGRVSDRPPGGPPCRLGRTGLPRGPPDLAPASAPAGGAESGTLLEAQARLPYGGNTVAPGASALRGTAASASKPAAVHLAAPNAPEGAGRRIPVTAARATSLPVLCTRQRPFLRGAGSCRSASPGTLSTTWAARGGARAAARPARRGLQAAPEAGIARVRPCMGAAGAHLS